MAEAAAALGIAAAAVQFFDFSLKALSLCKQIRDSDKGATQANQELETYISKLKQVHQNLRVDTRLQVANRPVTRARQDCIAIVDELQKLLDDVKSKSGDKNFAAAKATFRALKNKRGIEVLQNKLSQAQKRFVSALSIETRNDVALLLEGQEKLSDNIQKILLPEIHKAHAASAASHTKTQDQLVTVSATSSAAHGKTHCLLQDVQKNQESSLNVAKSTEVAVSKGLTTIGVQTNNIAINAEMAARRKEVLDSLWYPEMFERQQSIRPPLFNSFEWIFDDSPASEDKIQAATPGQQWREREWQETRGKFARWLRNDQSLFWISGKAGSGKSSLMSLIQSDPRTDEALSLWARGRRLHRFSFYFWRPGTSLQKTVHGLIRSLLYQLAQTNIAVIDYLTATQSTHCSNWTTGFLLAAFRKALSTLHCDSVFLMVDGLDEYEDDYDDLLDLILECQQGPCLKACVASRPETQILQRLRTYPSLRLQDLNYEDIKLFVEGRLEPYKYCIPSKIRDDLIARAEGVFLWAVLVSDDIKRGASAGDDYQTLSRRLSSIPIGLSNLFQRLLEDIDAEHLETLKLCLFHLDDRLWSRVGLYEHCLLSLITASTPKCEHIRTSEELIQLCIKNSKDIIAQGKGLLEFDSGMTTYNTSAWIFDSRKNQFNAVDKDTMALCQRRIRFVHRSAHDFVLRPENPSSVHDRLRLTEQDVDRLVEWIMRGFETLIRLMPLSISDSSPSFKFYPPRSVNFSVFGPVIKIIDICKKTKSAHTISEWLDRLYDVLPERFATQRKEPLSPAVYKAWSSKVDLSTTWHVEEDFWVAAVKLDGYLESRWNKLTLHQHSSSICSQMISRGISSSSLDRYRRHLLAKPTPESSVTQTKHIRNRIRVGNIESVSWNADGRMDEQYVMANMATFWSYNDHDEFSDDECSDIVPAWNQKIFVGFMESRAKGRLSIQVPICPAEIWRPLSTPFALSYRDITQLRLLSIFEPAKLAKIPYTSWVAHDVLIEEVCDVHMEFREEVPVWCYDASRRGLTFRGVFEQFSECFENVKKEIRANKENHLSPSQQLVMLDLVERHFRDYWDIVTPETMELLRITLKHRFKEDQEDGLLGDLW